MRCEGTTAQGKRCRAPAKRGEKLCSAHLGTGHRKAFIDTAEWPTMEARILAALRAGNYLSTAAEAAGLHPQTLSSYLERGEADREHERNTPYAAFFEAVKKARGEGEAALVARIARAGHDSWQANAWLLERQYPERWGRRDRVGLEHSGRVNVSHDEIDREIERLTEKLGQERS